MFICCYFFLFKKTWGNTLGSNTVRILNYLVLHFNHDHLLHFREDRTWGFDRARRVIVRTRVGRYAHVAVIKMSQALARDLHQVIMTRGEEKQESVIRFHAWIIFMHLVSGLWSKTNPPVNRHAYFVFGGLENSTL